MKVMNTYHLLHLLFLLLIPCVTAMCSSGTTCIQPVSASLPQCGKGTFTCFSVGASNIHWYLNEEPTTSMSIQGDQPCLNPTGDYDNEASVFVLDINCYSPWFQNGTNISCCGLILPDTGAPIENCSDTVLILLYDMKPQATTVECHENIPLSQILWTKPFSPPDLIIYNYTTEVYSNEGDLLYSYETEETEYSLQQEWDCGKVCIQAKTSAGLGCKSCLSGETSPITEAIPSSSTSATSMTTSPSDTSSTTPSSTVTLAPPAVGWILLTVMFPHKIYLP